MQTETHRDRERERKRDGCGPGQTSSDWEPVVTNQFGVDFIGVGEAEIGQAVVAAAFHRAVQPLVRCQVKVAKIKSGLINYCG